MQAAFFQVIWQPVPVYPQYNFSSSTAPFAVGINNDGGRSSAFFNNLVVDVNGLVVRLS